MDLRILEIASYTDNNKVLENPTHQSKNKKIDEVKTFVSNGERLFDNVKVNLEKHWKDFKEIFDKKNLSRKECLLLPIKTIAKALNL